MKRLCSSETFALEDAVDVRLRGRLYTKALFHSTRILYTSLLDRSLNSEWQRFLYAAPFDQEITSLVIPAMKTQILIIKLLLSFTLAGLLALCATYFTLAYYRLVSIAKGIAGPFEWPADVASSGDDRAYLEQRCDSGAYLDMDSVPQTIPKLTSHLKRPV
jgi:hypothetical protein